MNDTIVAVSTPIGEGGIAIVRLSGRDSLKIADRIFKSKDGKKASKFKTYTVHYGHIVVRRSSFVVRKNTKYEIRNTNDEIIDEVLLTVMKAPRSYTKEDIVEINCHGGIQAARKVLGLVMKRGARIAEPGEFTKRAFLNGRIDLAQAEAVLDVIRSKTEGSLKVAMDQLEGGLSKEVDSIRDAAIDLASQVEAAIDFPEEELETAEKRELIKKANNIARRLKLLCDTYGEGMVFREGVLAIICGKPNVGKSSLMNLLLKRDRVIVSPVPGTTRDAVEETINLKGVPIRLVDTAGIAEAKDALWKAGVARSKRYLELADIALLVLDGSAAIDKKDAAIIKLVGDKKKVVIINKTDLPKKINAKTVKKIFRRARLVEISVEKKKNIGRLERAISDTVWSGDFVQGEAAIVANLRHKELLDRALGNMLVVKEALRKGREAELVAIDIKEAVFNLGLIIGKSVSDDILDRIFEQFCVGK